MLDVLRDESARSLGRLCELPAQDAIMAAPSNPGLERIEARFAGDGYDLHRHDTYAIGITLHGVQTFWYRGERRYSLPGNIIVLHPDEVHDGGAGTDDGLRYRMLYLEPALALRALGSRAGSLPFVNDPVFADQSMTATLSAALGNLDEELDELLVDDVVSQLTQGLARHARQNVKSVGALAVRQTELARDYLEEHALRLVRSDELEAVSGLDRYALSRNFRALYATSPHRFLLMRRLQRAREMIKAREPLAEIAAATGFSDQSHLNRQFKKAFGLTPGRWAGLTGASAG
ncbi:AraC family transcriptional regulator [Phyllobacterium brassicacearum]|uniref:AraC family transcriptional regulator n=1 Tax=Phyllobacterium brassicacearum TaxID=314235 RepID=A0A2P7BSM4_9HYPH|nr:AraC family transcriptional regulator [Phyllobacterium brassicacearum]PSH69470.1 AraC family transcriptional regulator [Phyllobacterium brassicacearum]TDQ34341.1 AraC family transcriptional regulator [Phyllobacterium brassicacearum]